MASNFKSAFESIPGRDALFQYEDKSYPIRTYVERNGLIFKSLTATSENFVLSQWELIGDLREVRVPDIAGRNTLTGTTGTSFGVRTPILDNTNVLVLDASADPQVGSAQFARYNYNQGSESWLLLQVGTGSTSASTSIEYSNVLNRPFVVSGVTINAGGGLSGGGSVFGSIPAAGGTIALAHADTSSQANLTPTGRTYVQQLRFDTYGHVTGATSSVWTHPDTSSQANVLNTGRTYIQSISVDGDGHITNISSSPWTHPDTSTQANSVNAGNSFIQSIYLDGDGHVTGIGVGTASGGGGGGSPLTYNGNSGGALTMNSGATLNISGGTNILTVRTGNAANPGLRININPAGSTGQVQYNNGAGLGLAASPNFTFNPSTNTLQVSNYSIGATPTSGTTNDQFLTRNSVTGVVQRLSLGTITNAVFNGLSATNGLNKLGTTIRLGGNLTGHTTIGGSTYDLTLTTRSLTLGNRSVGTVGSNTFSIGTSNRAQGAYSLVGGETNNLTTTNSIAFGSSNIVTGSTFSNGHFYAFGNQNIVSSVSSSLNVNFAIGRFVNVTGTSFNSGGIGAVVNVGGSNTFAMGNYIKAGSAQSIVIGNGDASTSKYLTTTALRAILISNNTNGQIVGRGIHGQYGAIFGGVNHNIEAGNVRATIVGGGGINLTGSSYTDYTAMSNLAIFTTPSNGGSDDVLTWNPTNKKVGKVTQASLKSSPVGSTGSVQIRSASGNFGFDSGLLYSTGTSRLTTSNLAISSVPASGTTTQILTRNTSTGVVERIGLNAIAALPLNAIQYRTNTGFGGNAGFVYEPFQNGLTLGTRVVGSIGNGSVVIGTNCLASGANAAFAHGTLANATGNFSTAWGSIVTASGSVTFAGGANRSLDQTKPVLAAGDLSFNWSENDNTQTVGHGTLAQNSAILGGRNHNIEASNQRSVILGGNGIKLTGTSYSDHVAVPNLAIFNTPSNGGLNDILAWNPTNKKIGKVTQASLKTSPGGSTNHVQFNNGGVFSGSTRLTYTLVGGLYSQFQIGGDLHFANTSSGAGNASIVTLAADRTLQMGGASTTRNNVVINSGGGTSNGNVFLTTYGSSTANGGNVSLFNNFFGTAPASTIFGGGSRIMFINNATIVPTSNPSNGGFMYVESGALKYRGSSGTITTIAPA